MSRYDPKFPSHLTGLVTDPTDPGHYLIAQITAHLNHHASASPPPPPLTSQSGPSLSDLAIKKLIRTLHLDTSDESLTVLLKNTPQTLLTRVFQDAGLSYASFRRWCKFHPEIIEKLDDWIFANERAVRKRPEEEWDKILCRLEEGEGLWPSGPDVSVDAAKGVRRIKRRLPPVGHFAVLGEKRKKEMEMLSTDIGFKKRWDEVTGGILEGLDWSNVVAAGGLVLGCLTATDDEVKVKLKDADVDLYFYGLNPEEANVKVQEVWNSWSANLPAGSEKLVVRNAKTITFLGSYPVRRVQIVLKLCPNIASVLLNFDLDQCAIGFDGEKVHMLPRAARALETGYSVFTTDLIFGHYLSSRRATSEIRVFKYADRGYGILFLPSLISTAKLDFAPRNSSNDWGRQKYDKTPSDILTGRKVLSRIAFMAWDTVHRFYLGPTHATLLTHDNIDDLADSMSYSGKFRFGWDGDRRDASYADLDGREQHYGLPGGPKGLKMFETFMRMVSMWTFDHTGHLNLDRNSFESTEYHSGYYDDLPSYSWDSTFNPQNFTKEIDNYNNEIFDSLQDHVRTATGTQGWNFQPPQPERWSGYLTRRIRRIITAPDLSSVLSKQITIPLWVPASLATHIAHLSAQIIATHDLPTTAETQILIPGHIPDPSHISPPPIPTNLPKGYKLYYWVIGNTTQWGKMDRRLDEVFEALWMLYHAQFTMDGGSRLVPPVSSQATGWGPSMLQEACHTLVYLINRRPVPPSDPAPSSPTHTNSTLEENTQPGETPLTKTLRLAETVTLDPAEGVRFNGWLSHVATHNSRNYTENHRDYYKEDNGFVPREDWYWHPVQKTGPQTEVKELQKEAKEGDGEKKEKTVKEEEGGKTQALTQASDAMSTDIPPASDDNASKITSPSPYYQLNTDNVDLALCLKKQVELETPCCGACRCCGCGGEDRGCWFCAVEAGEGNGEWREWGSEKRMGEGGEERRGKRRVGEKGDGEGDMYMLRRGWTELEEKEVKG